MTDAPEASPVITDWRGTPITEGLTAIYGAPVGRSIAMVEAEVVGFTKTGRVNLRVLRRKTGGSWSEKEVVHVGADRLTIVSELPPTELPLLGDAIAERKAAQAERQRIRDTHDFPETRKEEYEVPDPYSFRGSRTRTAIRYVTDPCTKCGAERYSPESGQECPS